MRLANQVNLISALRTALLMLPATFTERELYSKIAGISYMGDLRMTLGAENPLKVNHIVDSQMTNFRQLYFPLIENLPNVAFNDSHTSHSSWIESTGVNCKLEQDMDSTKRGNMVRRLPKAFRKKLYNASRDLFETSTKDFEEFVTASEDELAFSSRLGSDFDKKIAGRKDLGNTVADVVRKTVRWPTVTQSLKGLLTAGPVRGWKYLNEKRAKGKVLKQEKIEKERIGPGK